MERQDGRNGLFKISERCFSTLCANDFLHGRKIYDYFLLDWEVEIQMRTVFQITGAGAGFLVVKGDGVKW